MPLIKCSKCSQDISDRANSCPHCGNVANLIKCQDCGREVSKRANSCLGCGAPIGNDDISSGNSDNTIAIITVLIPIIGLIVGLAMSAKKSKKRMYYTILLVLYIILLPYSIFAITEESTEGMVACFIIGCVLWILTIITALSKQKK